MRVDINKFIGFCGCGKEHKIMVKDIIIESEAIKKLSMIMEKEGFKNITIICDENTYAAAGEEIKEIIPKGKFINLKSENLHANEIAVQKVYECLSVENDVLIALGSGTIHDITRYVAYNKDIPFISVPTAASTDRCVSAKAALTWNGLKKALKAHPPVAVFADTRIFAHAPRRLTAAGVSDLFGKYVCLTDWKIAHLLTDEYICDEIIELEEKVLKTVKSCLRDIEEGDEGDCEKLMYGLILSGLAVQMADNSRPADGAEHHLACLWEMEVINGHLDAVHGEMVSVGTLLVLREYNWIARAIREGRCQVRSCPKDDREALEATFGEKNLLREVQKENDPEPLNGISPQRLESCLSEIADLIEELPREEELLQALKKAGCKYRVYDIGLSEDIVPLSLKLAPYMRNQLSLLRISKMLDIKGEQA